MTIAGNSFIENPIAPQVDPQMSGEHYFRSEAQDLACGLQPNMSHEVPDELPQHPEPPRNEGLDALTSSSNFAKKEVVQFETTCHVCNEPGQTNMCMTEIPHFKVSLKKSRFSSLNMVL